MKKLLVLGFIAGICSSLSAINIFDYVSFEGNPKGYTQTDFLITSKFGNYYRTPKTKINRIFDGNGFDFESLEYEVESASKTTLTNKIEYNYDAFGNLLQQNAYNADSELIWRTEVSYENGIKTQVSEFDETNKEISRIIFSYDEKTGILKYESGYNSDGTLMWKIGYKYDDKGRYSSIASYFADGSLDEEKTFEYTEDDTIKTITNYSSISGEKTKDVFRYNDETAKLDEIITYDKNNEIINRLVIKYDSVGNVAKLSNYAVSQKFGTTVNELTSQTEFVFEY